MFRMHIKLISHPIMRIEFEVRVNAALDDFCSIWKFNMAARVNYAF